MPKALDAAKEFISGRCLKPYVLKGTKEIRMCVMMKGHSPNCGDWNDRPTEMLFNLVMEIDPSVGRS